MNKIELQATLEKEGFDPTCYDLTGGLLPERYTLANEFGTWSVFYSEHGLQTGKVVFATESEACEYFLGELRSDPTTKRA
jgi:hypothetical protein